MIGYFIRPWYSFFSFVLFHILVYNLDLFSSVVRLGRISQGGSSCGFFKWCDDQQQQPRTAAPLQASPQYHQTGVTSTNQNTSKSSSACFKCGQENHWAKDCPNQPSDPYSDKGGRTLTPATSSDGCFKCGKAGHWSRDCPVATSGGGGGGGAVGGNVKSSSPLGSWNSRRYW
jgi:hypothetical protein